MAVDSISAQGEPQLTGNVTLSEGSNITLTQAGQDIEIAVAEVANSATNIGAVTATSLGTTVTTGGANAKGNYAQITASLTADCDGFWFQVTNGGGAARFLFDIATGANLAETVIVPNLLLFFSSQGQCTAGPLYIPLGISAGTRIAVRAQAHVATQTAMVTIQPITSTGARLMKKTRATTYGVDTATTTTPCSPDPDDTANTKGAYDELVASTTNPIEAFYVFIVPTAANVVNSHLFDIATGAALSEVVVMPNLYLFGNATSDTYSPGVYGLYPMDIPAGTRLSAREQVNGAGGTPSTYVSVTAFD